MTYYNFSRIKAQNFMSFKDVEFDLSDLGTVSVIGKNRYEPKTDSNGSGKSALFDMIIWLLTGSTSRGATAVANELVCNGVYVEGEIYINENLYVIRRSKNHPDYGSGLRIIKNGEDISGDTLTDSKSILKCELNNLDYDTLTSIIILSQGLPGRLSSLKSSSRKSRLEELSNTDSYIDDVKRKIEKAISKISDELSIINSKILSCDSEISSNNISININTKKINEITEKSSGIVSAERYEEIQLELKELGVKLVNYQNQYRDLQVAIDRDNNKIDLLNREFNTIKLELPMLLTKFSSITSSVCPTCGNHITSEEKIKEIKNNINSEIINRKQRLSEIINNKEIISDDIVTLKGKLIPITEEISNLRVEIDALTIDSNNYRSYSSSTDILYDAINNSKLIIESKEKEKIELTEKRDKLINKLTIANFYKNQASRKFRSFLLEGVINYMNHKSKEYSKYLFDKQGTVNIRINKNDIDIYLGDRKFENLSGGEGRRVDIILQLIQRDLARNESGLSSNVLVLDEILDYLDSTGIESVLRLIEYKSPDINSLLVVTHNKNVKVPADKVFTITKDPNQISMLTVS